MHSPVVGKQCFMEDRTLSHFKASLEQSDSPPLSGLAGALSLLTNPKTSQSSLSSVRDTLVDALLRTDAYTIPRRQMFKILSDLSTSWPALSDPVCDALSSLPFCLASLSAIIRLPHPFPLNIDDDLFMSLSFQNDAPFRFWLLKHADKLSFRSSLLLTFYLGFTCDLYPYVKELALNGLYKFCHKSQFEEGNLAEASYHRALDLLRMQEDCVRCAAVRVVHYWGQAVVSVANDEQLKSAWSNAIFIKLGSTTRDRSAKVRIEAFDCLSKTSTVSESLLLQALSKKVLPKVKEQFCDGIKGTLKNLIPRAAGAFKHGLEDDFHEVRKLVCHSLWKLSAFSSEFSANSFDVLVAMLNDDSVAIRAAALDALRHIYDCELHKIKDSHLHMLIGILYDKNYKIRSSSWDLLKLLKLKSRDTFNSIVEGVLRSLEMYPDDEAGILFALFSLGRNHEDFSVNFILKKSDEVEPVCERNMGLGSTKVAGILMLAISVSFSHQINETQKIPAHLFSYAVTFFGRIARALKSVVDQSSLLEHLFQCGTSPVNFTPQFPLQNIQQPFDEESKLVSFALAKIDSKIRTFLYKNPTEILHGLRDCNKELLILCNESGEYTSTYAFGYYYLKAIEFIVELHCQILPGGNELMLNKLDANMKEIKCKFSGLCEEENTLISELDLIIYVIKSKISVSDLEGLHSSKVRILLEGNEVLNGYLSNGGSDLINLREVLSLFGFNRIRVSKALRYARVEMLVCGNDLENGQPFVGGFPLCVPLEIKLIDVDENTKMWVEMRVGDDSVQYAYIGSRRTSQFSFLALFNEAPAVASFTMKICVALECCGSRSSLVALCPYQLVCFLNSTNNNY